MTSTVSLRSAFILLCFFSVVYSEITRIAKVQNYECPESKCGEKYDIIHVKATQVGSNDTIHYLWSAIGLPAIVVGHNNDPKTILKIDWNNGSLADLKIEFIPAIPQVSAIVFKDVTEYIDEKDDQNADKNIVGNIMTNFTWTLANTQNLSDGAAASFHAITTSKALLALDLKAFTKEGYDTEMPQEPVNANSVRFSFGLQNLPTTSKKSRFSIGSAFIQKSGDDAPSFSTSKSIDDDRTPGIFKLLSFKIPAKGHSDSFASWKPVAYNDVSRDHSKQTFLHNFPNAPKGTLSKYKGEIEYSIIDSLLDKTDAYTLKVSFGQQKDDYYRGSSYRVWTGLYGHGEAPQPSISAKMYLTLFLGFGIPLAIAVLIVLAIFIRKLRGGKKISYEQIN